MFKISSVTVCLWPCIMQLRKSIKCLRKNQRCTYIFPLNKQLISISDLRNSLNELTEESGNFSCLTVMFHLRPIKSLLTHRIIELINLATYFQYKKNKTNESCYPVMVCSLKKGNKKIYSSTAYSPVSAGSAN